RGCGPARPPSWATLEDNPGSWHPGQRELSPERRPNSPTDQGGHQFRHPVGSVRSEAPVLAGDAGEYRRAVLKQNAVRSQRRNPLARSHDAGQVQRIGGTQAHEATLTRVSPDGPELADRLGQRELLAGHSGDKAASPDLASGLEPAIHQQQITPERGVRFPLEQPAENDSISPE